MPNAKHISIDGTVYDVEPAAPASIGDGMLTIQKNGTSVGTFTANQSNNGTINITMDKSDVGLGNVPNVTTNNQTPTFSQAANRANIASGETLATIFGKIMKWFADLKTVAFSGSYTDLSNKPTIPTVNNGTLTIQKNGSNVATFTANQSSNSTANITVPTTLSGFTNDVIIVEYKELTGNGNNYIAGVSKSGYRLANAVAFSIGTTPFVNGVNCTGGTAPNWQYAILFNQVIPNGQKVYVDLIWVKP